jgi:D-alanine transaminase
MQTLAYYNGQISEIDEMMIPLNDRGNYFGDGAYDATVARNHVIFGLDAHIERFFNSMAAVAIEPTFTRDELRELLQELTQKLSTDSHMVYWQITRGTALRAHQFPTASTPNLTVTIRPIAINRADQLRDYTIRTEADIRFYMAHVKTLNLLPNVLAFERAVQAGVDETVFYREVGDTTRVTEAAHSNIHIIQDGKLVTAPADNLILGGIARQQLLAAAQRLGIPVEERAYTLNELREADEIILSNSALFAGRVIQVDGKPAGGRAGELFLPLQQHVIDEWFAATE